MTVAWVDDAPPVLVPPDGVPEEGSAFDPEEVPFVFPLCWLPPAVSVDVPEVVDLPSLPPPHAESMPAMSSAAASGLMLRCDGLMRSPPAHRMRVRQ
ncbi:hypothetical protein [Noviherbaspirillum sp. UKPF54]|uniref:hypothetical protein n=1 Tax=Noviherbaspirillum sp. UKPF54 TaxID=2601898 RepID=UPI0011B1915B|nr:hypothetical protein [Noviherbaspirillum sp. UKPF54]QDZ30044.1 hypothetical protein FAY22_20000 [Noviherbaspirillum sp. UKPF54]